MADDLRQLENWVTPLLAKLAPVERRRLALTLARTMRQRQQRTMAAQTAPDGTPWDPRKNAARTARGSVRRSAQAAKAGTAMFRGMRRAKWMKASASPSEASVGFVGRAARIAALHHGGGPDRVTPGGPTYDYPARPLIGFAPDLAEELRGLLIDHLTS